MDEPDRFDAFVDAVQAAVPIGPVRFNVLTLAGALMRQEANVGRRQGVLLGIALCLVVRAVWWAL